MLSRIHKSLDTRFASLSGRSKFVHAYLTEILTEKQKRSYVVGTTRYLDASSCRTRVRKLSQNPKNVYMGKCLPCSCKAGSSGGSRRPCPCTPSPSPPKTPTRSSCLSLKCYVILDEIGLMEWCNVRLQKPQVFAQTFPINSK